MSEKIEQMFKSLEKENKNNVDGLVKWLKDSKVIDETKAAEDKARKLFDDANDKSKIELSKMKEVVSKLAEEQKKTVEEMSQKLADEGPKFLNAMASAAKAGASAAADAFKEARKK